MNAENRNIHEALLIPLKHADWLEPGGTHLWLNDSKQVFPKGQLLGKTVVIFRLKGNAEEAHDARMGGEVQGDAVLSQEALQLGGGFWEHFQGHGRPCRTHTSFRAVRGQVERLIYMKQVVLILAWIIVRCFDCVMTSEAVCDEQHSAVLPSSDLLDDIEVFLDLQVSQTLSRYLHELINEAAISETQFSHLEKHKQISCLHRYAHTHTHMLAQDLF